MPIVNKGFFSFIIKNSTRVEFRRFYIIAFNGKLDRAVAQHIVSVTPILKLSDELVQILATLDLRMSYLRPTVGVSRTSHTSNQYGVR